MIVTRSLAILCASLLIAQGPYGFAQQAPSGPQGQPQQPLSAGQLDSLVAPIALFPDPILSQVLVASTYPLEVVEAGRWLKQNSNLSGKALADAAATQPWDASVQALVLIPDALSRLDQNINWTSDLGNAFLAQQQDVMDAVQRMRQRAMASGALQTTPQQTVSTVSTNGQANIQIEPASPQVVYVPVYNPEAVWGAPPAYYPYPPIYYPPSTGAAIAAGVIGFGTGVLVGGIISGGWGGWGWNPGWGSRTVIVNNNFINNNRFNRASVANGNRWVHNPAFRGGVPYNNSAVAQRFQGAGNRPLSRPTPAQIQQGLNRGQVGNPAGGSANRMAPGSLAGRGGTPQGALGQRGIGSANRMAPGNPALGGGAGNMANRVQNPGLQGATPRGAFGGVNRGGMQASRNANRGFASAGGGGFHGGGFRGGRRR
jgi:hypothetical protein